MQFSFDLEGIEVRSFNDAESLLASGELPAAGCLVLDYHLPGADGLELLTRLRAKGVRMPAVLITTKSPRPSQPARGLGRRADHREAAAHPTPC
ncbi:MAG: response regulator [Brevundimonas sp.]|nr:response regulator [Brevundimonas sp.]